MANPLMGSNPQNGGGMFGNMANILSSFQQFKKSFQGDPRQQVQDLLNSGKMTQEQLQQCESIARNLQGFLH